MTGHGVALSITAFLCLATGVAVLAAKAGETGPTSTASIGISLEIRASIRAKNVSLSSHGDGLLPSSSGRHLCLDADSLHAFSLLALARGDDGTRLTPLLSGTATGRCTDGALRVDLDGVDPPPGRPLTVLIAPE